jgi:ubiquitin-protein ligase
VTFWYLRDLARLEREQAAIAELATSVEWLVSSVWMLDGTALTLNAVIHAHGHDYPVRLCYPHYFPSSPPTLHPVGAETRWTSHQYGDVNGALCLEWGPDNWQPDVTGAQVLESAYRLFDIENPRGEGANIERSVAPSRHKLTQGQELRFNQSRLYVSPALRALITSSSYTQLAR